MNRCEINYNAIAKKDLKFSIFCCSMELGNGALSKWQSGVADNSDLITSFVVCRWMLSVEDVKRL